MSARFDKPLLSRLVAFLAVAILSVGAAAQDTQPASSAPNPAAPASMAISQVASSGSDMTLYLDVRASNGRFVRGVTAARLSATVGENAATIGSVEAFDSTPDGVWYLFLVDISKSLTSAEFNKIKQALDNWVNTLRPKDRVAILTFGEEVETLASPTSDRATLREAIDSVGPTDNKTVLFQGLTEAIELMASRSGADLPERRVIVTLTDGVDDSPEGVGSPAMLRELLEEEHIPIYAVGYANRGAGSAAVRDGLNDLGEFSQRSGGGFIDARGRTDLGAVFSDLRQRIQEVYKVQVGCAECPLDDEPRPLRLKLESEGFSLDDRIDVRLTSDGLPPVEIEPLPQPEEPVEPAWFEQYWPYLVAGAVALLLLVWLVLLLRRPKPAPAADPDDEEDLAFESQGETGAALGSDLAGDAFDIGPAPPPVPPVPMTPGAEYAQPPSTPPPRPASPPSPPQPAYQGPRSSIALAAVGGPRSGERITLQLAPEAVIGRAPDCALSLADDPEASGRHASIELLEGARVVLRDLGSTNGTRLNGVAVQGAQLLSDGDLVGVGQSEFRVSL